MLSADREVSSSFQQIFTPTGVLRQAGIVLKLFLIFGTILRLVFL